MSDDSVLIAIDKVRIGMFIKLELNWFQHPFPMKSFKITNEHQLHELLALNLKHIRYIPSKSDLDEQAASKNSSTEKKIPHSPADAASSAQVFNSIIEAKRARFELLKKQREELAACEEKFVSATKVISNISKTLLAKPEETIAEASKLVDGIAESMLSTNDNIMHLIQKASANEELYFHNLNVSVLGMMLANELKCNDVIIKAIGMAGLFHDLGKMKIPDKILLKTDALTKPEFEFLKLHTQYGTELGKKAGLAPVVMEVIANHHEHLDGSGYPQQLKGDAIRLPTRIVTIANVYDNLCNHVDSRQSLTPHEALSSMYAHRRAQFDPIAMATLIKSLGVYPPGTLVRLSNEAIGLVMSVNIGKPLRPRVLVYDSDTPKEDAIILDLSDETDDITIVSSIRPGALPKAIFDYLNPRTRVSFFVDSSSKKSVPKPATAKA
jgi:putative nucleotidyltransferase with HDIG domain